MSKNPIKFLWHCILYLIYKSECVKEHNLYMTAKNKGMYCEDINYHTGIAKFDPNRPPQEEPKCVSFKEAMKNLNKK